MSRKTSESRASRAAEMLRGSRRINDSTIRRIAEKTGLSDTIITEIAKPIRQAKAEQEAIDSAERTLAAAERRVRREQAPCPICNTGYAHPFDFDTLVRIGWRKNPDTGDRIPVSIWAHPYFCECSNRRCVARNIFPADSEREAVSPVTRRKDWWRCACRSCGRRDNGSHPSREEAREAFAGLSGSTGEGPRGRSLAVG